MAITVTCPGCLKRFSVSDKFAGKTGPCPNCQKQLKIPEKADEVVIHAPDEAGPKDSKGRSIFKPIRREEVKLSLPVIMTVALSSLVITGLALGLGLSGGPPAVLLPLGALTLAFLGYWFLRDDEKAGYTGKELLIRCGICGVVFAATWGIYGFLPSYINGNTGGMVENTSFDLAIFVPVMVALGTFAALAAFELEIASSLLLYMFYFGVTLFLAWLSGAGLGDFMPGSSPASAPPPARVAPATPGPTPAPPASPAMPPSGDGPAIPKLLQ